MNKVEAYRQAKAALEAGDWKRAKELEPQMLASDWRYLMSKYQPDANRIDSDKEKILKSYS